MNMNVFAEFNILQSVDVKDLKKYIFREGYSIHCVICLCICVNF